MFVSPRTANGKLSPTVRVSFISMLFGYLATKLESKLNLNTFTTYRMALSLRPRSSLTSWEYLDSVLNKKSADI